MDAVVFDRVTLQLCRLVSRRATIGGLGLAALVVPGLVDAKKRKRKNKRRNNKKPTYNSFGCVNVGGFCQNNDQCCSGICQGEKDQNLRTCQGHNTSACQGEDACADDNKPQELHHGHGGLWRLSHHDRPCQLLRGECAVPLLHAGR